MATITPTRSTPEDLLTITDRPMPELVDGRLLEREKGQKADAIAATILVLIGIFVRTNRLGMVNGAQGSYQIFPDDPTKVRIPDASFTRRDRIPEDGPAQGHARIAPDLVVEVISPNDTVGYLEPKIEDYLSAGVPLIWVIYPETRTVLVQRLDGTATRLRVGGFLDGEAILPGFRCEVSSLFD